MLELPLGILTETTLMSRYFTLRIEVQKADLGTLVGTSNPPKRSARKYLDFRIRELVLSWVVTIF